MAEVFTGEVGPRTVDDGDTSNRGFRMDRSGALVTQTLHGRYYEQANRGNVYSAHAIITAPVIYTTAAGTGGPLLWNGSTTHKAVILSIGWGVSVVSTVAASLGITGGTGQVAAPSSTTAVDSVKNMYLGGGAPAVSAFRLGTVTTAGNFFIPFGDLHTGALTVQSLHCNWFDVGGMIVVPQFGWVSIAASATASSTVANFGIIWEEILVDG